VWNKSQTTPSRFCSVDPVPFHITQPYHYAYFITAKTATSVHPSGVHRQVGLSDMGYGCVGVPLSHDPAVFSHGEHRSTNHFKYRLMDGFISGQNAYRSGSYSQFADDKSRGVSTPTRCELRGRPTQARVDGTNVSSGRSNFVLWKSTHERQRPTTKTITT
jgi:hypothetical protein